MAKKQQHATKIVSQESLDGEDLDDSDKIGDEEIILYEGSSSGQNKYDESSSHRRDLIVDDEDIMKLFPNTMLNPNINKLNVLDTLQDIGLKMNVKKSNSLVSSSLLKK